MSDSRTDSAPGGNEPTASRAAGDHDSYSVFEGATEDFGIGPGGTDPLIGADIGGVTIVRLIGQGGMGRVYEARQVKPSRPVAVKVIRPGVVSESHLRRFDHEAEILARLRHPGIAQIHTVGTYNSPAGDFPFFVMEYIPDATTLVEYADHKRLSTHERLELFRKVCDAVAHGHTRGVVHRDLKPSNILVDAAGQPKVIDFGVAKTTDVDIALTTMRTHVGQLLGTLQYMSPEQFDGLSDEVDVRSDVYALGVVLYELLAGQPPYDVRRKAVVEAARVVKEEDPTPLSSLNRTLRRDVGVIAGKCLAKEPSGRYSSAAELGADVGRYLAGEPIHASPPGFVDGVVRLARRHKAAAAVVGAVAVSLVIAVVGISLFAARAEREREAAAKNTAIAEYRRNISDLNRFQLLKERGESANAFALLDDIEARFAPDDVPVEVRVTRSEADDAIAVYQGRSFAFSPDGTLLAIGSVREHSAEGSGTQVACLLDSITGERVARFEEPHGGYVAGPPHFSADGNYVAFGASHREFVPGWSGDWPALAFGPVDVVRWDTTDGRARSLAAATTDLHWRDFLRHGPMQIAAGFNPDSGRAVFVSSDDVSSSSENARMRIHCGPDVADVLLRRPTTVARSGSGDTLVFLDGQGALRVVDNLDQTDWGNLEIRDVRFAPDRDESIYRRIAIAKPMRRVLAVSHDGAMVCCESAEGECCVVAVDNEADEALTVVDSGDEHVVTSAMFDHTASTLITVTSDGALRAWRFASGTAIWTAETGCAGYSTLHLSPEGLYVAVQDMNTVVILDANDGATLTRLAEENRTLTAMRCSPTDDIFAVGDDVGVVTVHGLPRGEVIHRIEQHDRAISVITFSADGSTLATSGGGVAIFRLYEDLSVRLANDWQRIASFDPTGTKVVSADTVGIDVHDTRDGSTCKHYDLPDEFIANTSPYDIWFTSTGKTMLLLIARGTVVGFRSNAKSETDAFTLAGLDRSDDYCGLEAFGVDEDVTRIVFQDGPIAQLWDADRTNLIAYLDSAPGQHESFVFSPDGTRLLGCWLWSPEPEYDDYIYSEADRLRDEWTNAVLKRFSIPSTAAPRNTVENNADSTGSWCLYVLWDARTGREITAFCANSQRGGKPAFSPDSQVFALPTEARSSATGELLGRWENETGDQVAFAPDGCIIAVPGKQPQLFERTDSDVFRPLRRAFEYVHKGERSRGRDKPEFYRSPSFSSDGSRIVFAEGTRLHVFTRSGDGKTKPAFIYSRTLRGRDIIDQPVFSSDGARVAAHIGDDHVGLWDVTSPLDCTFLGNQRLVSFDVPRVTVLASAEDTRTAHARPRRPRRTAEQSSETLATYRLSTLGFEHIADVPAWGPVASNDAVTPAQIPVPGTGDTLSRETSSVFSVTYGRHGKLTQSSELEPHNPFTIRLFQAGRSNAIAEQTVNAVSPTGTVGIKLSPPLIVELATGRTWPVPELAQSSHARHEIQCTWSADEHHVAFAVNTYRTDDDHNGTSREGTLVLYRYENGTWLGPVVERHFQEAIDLGEPGRVRGPSNRYRFSFARRGSRVYFAQPEKQWVFPHVGEFASNPAPHHVRPLHSALALNADMTRVVSVEQGVITIRDTEGNGVLGTCGRADNDSENPFLQAEFDANGSHAVIYGPPRRPLFWSSTKPHKSTPLGNYEQIGAAAFSANGDRLVVLASRYVPWEPSVSSVYDSRGRTISEFAIFDGRDGQFLVSVPDSVPMHGIEVTFCNEGRHLLTYRHYDGSSYGATLWGLTQREITRGKHDTQADAAGWRTAIESWLRRGSEEAVAAMQAGTAGMSDEQRRVVRGAFLARACEHYQLQQRQAIDALRAKAQPIADEIHRQAVATTRHLDAESPECTLIRHRFFVRQLTALRETMPEAEFIELLQFVQPWSWDLGE